MISGHATTGVRHFFLMTTTLTSVAGFLLPADQQQPSHILGILSLVAFGTARLVGYCKKMPGGWRKTCTVAAMLSLTSTSSCRSHNPS